MIELEAGSVDEIAVVGAHCDDIAIGMGGTLLTMAQNHPKLRVRGLVLCGGGTEREQEEREALSEFCRGVDIELTVLDIPDGRAPAQWNLVKDSLKDFARNSDAQVVFGPQRGDAHQDHRLLAELLPTEFRDHLVLGYEILKWETDTARPTILHPVARGLAEEKARLLMKHYPSQTHHDWFDEQAFLGLSRLRGVQCRHAHAEGFLLEKATVTFQPC
jgi:LmbE family N-acetylglucosaminyl deacetylase